VSGHLTRRQIERHRQRVLPPEELLAIDDHIQQCPSCRDLLARQWSQASLFAAWESLAADAADDPVDIAADAGDSAAHPSQVPHPVRPPHPLRPTHPLHPSHPSLTATSDPSGHPGALAAPWRRHPVRAIGWAAAAALGVAAAGVVAIALARLSPAAPAVRLADGARLVALDSGGGLRGLDDLPDGLRDEVAAALRDGRLAQPAAMGVLRGATANLRGEPPAPGAGSAGFAPLSPVATVVREDRPMLRWLPLAGASTYRVVITDAAYHSVASSGPIAATSWQPGDALARGALYCWEVRAAVPGGEVTAPALPAPEARFRVLPAAGLAPLAAESAAARGSHLALAVVYARQGLVEDAAREVEAVAAANPGQPSVERLRSSLVPRRNDLP
jgi:hypothetical protein